eukprot:1563574-Pleurochrysis_carterae.AAC.1
MDLDGDSISVTARDSGGGGGGGKLRRRQCCCSLTGCLGYLARPTAFKAAASLHSLPQCSGKRQRPQRAIVITSSSQMNVLQGRSLMARAQFLLSTSRARNGQAGRSGSRRALLLRCSLLAVLLFAGLETRAMPTAVSKPSGVQETVSGYTAQENRPARRDDSEQQRTEPDDVPAVPLYAGSSMPSLTKQPSSSEAKLSSVTGARRLAESSKLRAVPLFYKPSSETAQLVPAEEGLNVLRAQREPFAIVSAVGPTRTGKSSILGRAFLRGECALLHEAPHRKSLNAA